jgi:hydrogenase expression/formation protein HypD
MTLKHIEEYRDSELAGHLAEKIRRISRRNIRLMEVCGTTPSPFFG